MIKILDASRVSLTEILARPEGQRDVSAAVSALSLIHL